MAGPIELKTHFGLGGLRQTSHSGDNGWREENHGYQGPKKGQMRKIIIPPNHTLPINCQLVDVDKNGRLKLTFQIHGLNLEGSSLEKLHFLKAKRWYIPQDADDSVYCVLPNNRRLVWAVIQKDTIYCAVRTMSPVFPPLFDFEKPIEELAEFDGSRMGITPKHPDLITLGFPRK